MRGSRPTWRFPARSCAITARRPEVHLRGDRSSADDPRILEVMPAQRTPPPVDLSMLLNQAGYALANRLTAALAELDMSVRVYCVLAKAAEGDAHPGAPRRARVDGQDDHGRHARRDGAPRPGRAAAVPPRIAACASSPSPRRAVGSSPRPTRSSSASTTRSSTGWARRSARRSSGSSPGSSTVRSPRRSTWRRGRRRRAQRAGERSARDRPEQNDLVRFDHVRTVADTHPTRPGCSHSSSCARPRS